MSRKAAEDGLERVLAIERHDEFADALMELIDCSEDELYARLPSRLRTAVAVNAFSLEVNSGGFYQLVANSSPALLEDVLDGLGRIHAGIAERALREIRGRFPGGRIPEDDRERGDLLDEMDAASGGRTFRELDAGYKSSGEDVLALLRSYVQKQKARVAAELDTWR